MYIRLRYVESIGVRVGESAYSWVIVEGVSRGCHTDVVKGCSICYSGASHVMIHERVEEIQQQRKERGKKQTDSSDEM